MIFISPHLTHLLAFHLVFLQCRSCTDCCCVGHPVLCRILHKASWQLHELSLWQRGTSEMTENFLLANQLFADQCCNVHDKHATPTFRFLLKLSTQNAKVFFSNDRVQRASTSFWSIWSSSDSETSILFVCKQMRHPSSHLEFVREVFLCFLPSQRFSRGFELVRVPSRKSKVRICHKNTFWRHRCHQFSPILSALDYVVTPQNIFRAIVTHRNTIQGIILWIQTDREHLRVFEDCLRILLHDTQWRVSSPSHVRATCATRASLFPSPLAFHHVIISLALNNKEKEPRRQEK